MNGGTTLYFDPEKYLEKISTVILPLFYRDRGNRSENKVHSRLLSLCSEFKAAERQRFPAMTTDADGCLESGEQKLRNHRD